MPTRLAAIASLIALPWSISCGGSSPSATPEQGPSADGSLPDVSPGGADGGGGPADGPAGSDLFSDPSIPTCMQGFVADTRITGTVAGQNVSVTGGGGSSLTATTYSAVAASGTANSGGMIWYPLDLTWAGALVEGQSAPLTGGHISLMPDDANGPYVCVEAGDFGAEPLASDAAVGRAFRFRVTSARPATVVDGGASVVCSGAPEVAALAGCIYRTSTAL